MINENFKYVVENFWSNLENHLSIQECCAKFGDYLKQWDGSEFRKIPKRINGQRNLLKKLKNSQKWAAHVKQIRELETSIDQLAHKEEIYWHQRSRVNWLKNGDRNTKFFHCKASERRTQNFIKGFISTHGDFCSRTEEMQEIVQDYFSELFKSSNPSEEELKAATEHVKPKVTKEMNDFLDSPFSETEIKKATFELGAEKAPGPDGFPGIFFQKYWGIVGKVVTREVLKVLNGNATLEEWNETIITLIPKVRNPLLVKEYRPISLSNFCYKIVSRAISNRLKQVLKNVIDENQSAFIPGRLITDNIILSFESMHWIRNHRKGKYGFAALKLDLSKAFDRVEWKFIDTIMNKLGFSKKWINLVMNCISTVSFSFNINSEIHGKLKPERGIRQGDPLSPYIFVICAQGLSSLFSACEERKMFKGVKIASGCPTISHLFFADDSLVFFRALKEDVLTIKKCLSTYGKASGQVVNFEKSALTFSPNTSSDCISIVKNALEIPEVEGHNLYLGLPTMSLRSKTIQFQYLKNKVIGKLQGWRNRTFSSGGKEVLIKAVLQSIPTFAMSCFKIPDSICADIEKECSNFWWGVDNGKKCMHWKNWDTMCRPKCMGGIGFRKMGLFNKALLAKQVWRVIQNPDSFMAKILKARYFKHVDIMEAKIGSNPSYIWRSLCWSRDLLASGLFWRVGKGDRIRVFVDKWTTHKLDPLPGCFPTLDRNCKVETLIENGAWNNQLIFSCFPHHCASEIVNLPPPRVNSPDSRFWFFAPKGQYTMRDGYRKAIGLFEAPLNNSEFMEKQWWKTIWRLNIPPKVRIFWWKLSNDCIPTILNLVQHHVPAKGGCRLCCFGLDTTAHSFFFCEKIKHLWKQSKFWPLLKQGKFGSTMEICGWMKKKLNQTELEEFAMLAWAVWEEKRKIMHGNGKENIADSVLSVLDHLKKFQESKMGMKVDDKASNMGDVDKFWLKPGPGMFRLDVDARVNFSKNEFSVGGVIRDSYGEVVIAFGKKIANPKSVLEAELQAILHGIEMADSRSLTNLIVTSDSEGAMQAVMNPEEDMGIAGLWASNIHSVGSKIGNVTFKQIRRTANNVAHSIAHFISSFSSPNFIVWERAYLPSWLQDVVIKDLSC